jgi:hypothetical protein
MLLLKQSVTKLKQEWSDHAWQHLLTGWIQSTELNGILDAWWLNDKS